MSALASPLALLPGLGLEQRLGELGGSLGNALGVGQLEGELLLHDLIAEGVVNGTTLALNFEAARRSLGTKTAKAMRAGWPV